MPTPAKRAAPATAKRATKKAGEPVSKPFLRFHHSHELRVKTLEVLVAVENAEKATAYSAELIELVLELTESGMDQYFLQSLKATKANFVVQQSAALGLAGVQKVMGTVIRNILGRMDDRQLLVRLRLHSSVHGVTPPSHRQVVVPPRARWPSTVARTARTIGCTSHPTHVRLS